MIEEDLFFRKASRLGGGRSSSYAGFEGVSFLCARSCFLPRQQNFELVQNTASRRSEHPDQADLSTYPYSYPLYPNSHRLQLVRKAQIYSSGSMVCFPVKLPECWYTGGGEYLNTTK